MKRSVIRISIIASTLIVLAVVFGPGSVAGRAMPPGTELHPSCSGYRVTT